VRINKRSWNWVHSSPPDALPKVLDDGSLRENKSRITELRRQLANLRATLTPDHYKVIQVQSQLAELEEQAQTERAAIVKRIQNDHRAATRREELLKSAYANQLAVVSHQSAMEVRYNILKREVDANRDLYQSMLHKVREASVMAALRASNVRVIDPAKVTLRPYQPNPILNSAIGIFAGCMFGLLYVLIRERSNQSIRAPGESTRLLDVPELASIPAAKRDICTQIPIGSAPGDVTRSAEKRLTLIPGKAAGSAQRLLTKWATTESLVAESFRSAVTSILLWSRYSGSHQVIVVTNAHAKAGKTTSVFNLGLGLPESGRRVLVIDGDLRRPRLGKILGFEDSEGLSDILGEGRSLAVAKSLIRETVVAGLCVLPSGSTRPNVPQLLHSSHLGKLIGQLRSEFDFVLIDSPPSIPLTDSRLFAKHADGVILICLAGETSVDQLLSVRKCFSNDGSHVIGTILNGWNARAENPSYLHSYADYYSKSSVE
jgi:succinoglycan biosynthesis transport protein ExoP